MLMKNDHIDINQLIKSLSIEEKIGQMMQLAPSFFVQDIQVELFGQIQDLNLDQEKIFYAGSVLGNHSADEMITIQKKYLQKSRHKIPLMFMADVVHGFKTIFPVPLAIAASWNPELAKEAAHIQAKEARVSGVQVTFSPMVDISRDPRWGRIVESYGADPYLSSVFSRASVEGYQGEDIKSDESVAACVKHFAAYGASESGRDYNTVDVSNYSLHNIYLPSYKAAIDAGAKMIMTSFNTVDGIPATINKYLLKDILRDKWQFDGVVISDYDSLHQVVAHGVAKDDKVAAYRAIEAGLDIEMQSTCYTNYLNTLILENKISEKQIDEAVFNILKLKKELGLFENPFQGTNSKKAKEIIRSKDHLERAEKIAEESMVLLKNDKHLLPLNKHKTYAILGPYANTKKTNGAWAGYGDNETNDTLPSILTKNGVQISFINQSLSPAYDDEQLKIIEASDGIILALGEDEYESGEAHSKVDVSLPREQHRFVDFAKDINKDTIVLLYHGRPFVLSNILKADVILDTFYLGSRANQAIANVLIGKVNPSGKLPVSYPRHGGQIPLYYNHLNTGRPHPKGSHAEYTSFYLDEENDALFPFGFGLSYSEFKYGFMKVSNHKITQKEGITIKIDVKNISKIAGFETIQLYIKDEFAYYARPVKELKQFKKVYFEANETKTIEFFVSSKDLVYFDSKGNEILEEGMFKIMIGSHSESLQETQVEYIGGKYENK